MATFLVFETHSSPDEAIRRRWGKNLTEQMDAIGMTPKRLVIDLAAHGVDASRSSISQWMRGDVAPQPSKMIALAKALHTSPRLIFTLDIELVEKAA